MGIAAVVVGRTVGTTLKGSAVGNVVGTLEGCTLASGVGFPVGGLLSVRDGIVLG